MLVPSDTGRIGAWLVAGPFRRVPEAPTASAPGGLTLGAALGPTGDVHDARVAASSRGPVDLFATLGDAARKADNVYALASATLDVREGGDHTLLLGVDDGVTVWLDGREVFTRDEARPMRDADDVIPLDLRAGKHTLVLRLHQRTGAWGFRARLVSPRWTRPALDVVLPGAGSRALEVALRLADIRVQYTRKSNALYPRARVAFPEGRPRGVALPVSVSLQNDARAAFTALAGDAGDVGLPGGDELAISLPEVTSPSARITVEVAGTQKVFVGGASREALEALAAADAVTAQPQGTLARTSYAFARERLDGLVRNGDRDIDAQTAEARELAGMTRELVAGDEPYQGRKGVMRLAVRSPVDGELHEFGLHVPATYNPRAPRPYPLVVVLHGMDGYPMSALQWFFGFDDFGKDGLYEDRHPIALPPLDAFVLAPSGLGNTMYRELGLEDVMDAIAHVKDAYPIDGDRVTITGPSMGGIGSAMAALRYPSTFAAAMPLCGYHSLFIRRDIAGVVQRPWEPVLAEERSNVFWAENGKNTPLWIMHGTRDLPEANSGVLIERYEQLGFSVKHDHPDRGHDVWRIGYDKLKGATWLLDHTRPKVPWNVNHLRTYRTRFGTENAATLVSQERCDAAAELTTWPQGGDVFAQTSNVHELALTRPDVQKPARLRVGGEVLAFDAGEELRAHRAGTHWVKGADAPGRKAGRVTGPIRDVFHENVLFVYGTKDPLHARVNEEVARAWAAIRPAVTVRYPIISDDEFVRRGELLANDHALFLVGDAVQNAVTAQFGDRLPFRIEGDTVRAHDRTGTERVFRGTDLGATYIFPNPERADKYLVVVAATSPRAAWLSTYLPDLVPDFVVYDAGVQKSRGQLLLGRGNVLAGGFFAPAWTFGEIVDDRERKVPPPRTENDATPYLP